MSETNQALLTLASHLESFSDLLKQLKQTPSDSATIISLLETSTAIKCSGLAAGLVDFAGFGAVLEGVLSRACLAELQCDPQLCNLLEQSNEFFFAIWHAESTHIEVSLENRQKAAKLLNALIKFYLAEHLLINNIANQLYESEQTF